MKAEDLVIDKGGEGEIIKKIGEVFPDNRIAILTKAFVIETIDLGDLAGLMVASEDRDALRVTDLKSDKKGNSFNRVITAIDVVTSMQVVLGLVTVIMMWANVPMKR